MRLKKYNEGGGFIYTPFLFNIGANTSQPSTTTSGTKKSTKQDEGFDFDKALLEAIKTNGLQSDYTVFMEEVSKMMTNMQYQALLTDQEFAPVAQLAAIYNLANNVSENKKSYDTAVQTLQNNQAWSEIATDTNGQIYAIKDGSLQTVTPTEYYKNKEEYTPLTNGQVMHFRAQTPGLAFQQSVLVDMANATSMENVSDFLREVIKDFESVKLSGYTTKQKGEIQSGLNKLLMGDGPDGYYQYSSERQIQDEKDMQLALEYLYNILPANMKNLIIAKTAVENGNPNSMDRLSILAMALQRHTKSDHSVKYDNDANEVDDGVGSKVGNKTVQSTYLENIMTGKNYTRTNFVISPEQSTIELKASGYNVGRIVDAQQNPLGANNLRKLAETSQTLMAADLNSVYFGEQLIEAEDLNSLVWNGTSDVKFVDLPTTMEQGRIVPDFAAMLHMQEILDYVKNGAITSAADIQRRIDSAIGPNRAKYDATSKTIKFDPRQQARFITFSVYGSDDNIDIEESPLLIKLSNSEGKHIKDLYNRLVQWGSLSEGKGSSVYPQGDAWRNSFYQGNVFIKMNDPIHGTAFTNPQYSTMGDYMDISNKMRLRQGQVSGGEFKTGF